MFSWPVTAVRFPDELPESKDSLFRTWTGCTRLQLHLSSPQVMTGDMFLSCWTSSVINRGWASLAVRVVLLNCIMIENGYFSSDQFEQFHTYTLRSHFSILKHLEENMGCFVIVACFFHSILYFTTHLHEVFYLRQVIIIFFCKVLDLP